MPWANSETQFPRRLVVTSSDQAAEAGIQIGTTDQLGASSATTLAYNTTLTNWVTRTTNAAGAAGYLGTPAFPVAFGSITIAAGATSGTATVPAGITFGSAGTHALLYGPVGSATTVSMLTAPLFTISGTTLTATVTDPGGATSLTLYYIIWKI